MKKNNHVNNGVFTNYVKFTKSERKAWWNPVTPELSLDKRTKKTLKKNSLVKLMRVKPMLIKWGCENEPGSSVNVAMKEKEDEYWIGVFKDSHEGCILLIENKDGNTIELFFAERLNDNGFILLQMSSTDELAREIAAIREAYRKQKGNAD